MSLPRFRRRPAAAVALAALAAVSLAACAEDVGPSYYPAYAAGSVARVDEGVVVAARPIHFRGYDNGAGTIAGGVAGGLIGSSAGGWRDGAALGIAGAIGGALIGHAIASSANDHDGYEYLVRLNRGGGTIQVPQPDRYPIAQGTRVYVSYGERVRVQPIAGYAPPPPPPPPYR